MVGTVDYISYAHIEARKSVPDSVTEFFMKVGRYFQADWLLSKLTNNVLSKFVTLNLELQAIHDKLLKEELLIENPQEDYKAIRDIVRLLTRADEIFETIDYFENPKARLEALRSSNGQVSTGWKTIDKKLYGGFNRGELNIFAGGSGAGKSLFLANLGVNFALAGLNVVYLTLELSEALVSMRIDSMITGVSTREIFKNLDDIEMKVKMIGKKSGMLQVKYMPSGKTVNDIRAYLKEYEIKCGKKVDVLLVDYMDLLMPIGKKISAENLFVKDKYVSEELRNLAMEKQCVFVTAAQLNRGAVEEVEFDHSHISGGLSKIQTADNVFGIFTSRAMRERGRYQIQLMKTRSSSGVGQKVDLEFNIESLKISDLPEDEQESTNGASRGGSSIIEQIKRKTELTAREEPNDSKSGWERAEPKDGFSLDKPKVRAQVESTKLREILNSMNTDEE